MAIAALPTPPTRQDPDNFAVRGDAFLAALPGFVTQANALADEVNQHAADVAATAELVIPASAAALAGANYVGRWIILSGSLALPASTFHAGRFWILLDPLANVATAEPGVSASWGLVADDVGRIEHYPFDTPPPGTMVADGSEVSRAVYARLWAKAQADGAIAVDLADWAANPGKFYVGDGSTTFNLPDLRGDVLRALDGGKGVDPGRGLGTLQLPAIAGHTHTGTTGTESADHSHAISVNTTSLTGAFSHRESGPISASGIASLGGVTTQFDGGGAYTGSATVNLNATHSHTASAGGRSATHTHSFTTNSTGGPENRVRTTAYLVVIRF